MAERLLGWATDFGLFLAALVVAALLSALWAFAPAEDEGEG